MSPREIQANVFPHRIVLRVARKAQARLVEWLASFQQLGLGVILLTLNPGVFQLSPSFLWMSETFDETGWGIILFAVGFGRIVGLIINGSMESVTSWIRVAGAVCGFMLFVTILTSISMSVLALGNPLPTGLAMYLPAAVAEVAAMYFATRDAKIYQESRKADHGRGTAG